MNALALDGMNSHLMVGSRSAACRCTADAMLEESPAATWCSPARRFADHGHATWALVKERGYEGLVGNDEESTYRRWDVARLAQTEGALRGRLTDRRHRDERHRGRGLRYVGFLEYGFTRASIDEILRRSRSFIRATSPFATPDRVALWLEPELLAGDLLLGTHGGGGCGTRYTEGSSQALEVQAGDPRLVI